MIEDTVKEVGAYLIVAFGLIVLGLMAANASPEARKVIEPLMNSFDILVWGIGIVSLVAFIVGLIHLLNRNNPEYVGV